MVHNSNVILCTRKYKVNCQIVISNGSATAALQQNTGKHSGYQQYSNFEIYFILAGYSRNSSTAFFACHVSFTFPLALLHLHPPYWCLGCLSVSFSNQKLQYVTIVQTINGSYSSTDVTKTCKLQCFDSETLTVTACLSNIHHCFIDTISRSWSYRG